jgi:dephospho-CoA kinase
MSNLVIISGPQAVGKMTVAENLKEKIGYSLMVNHDSIEVSNKIFGRKTDAQKELNGLIREAAFNVAIKHNENIIFTYVVAYDDETSMNYLYKLKNLFENSGGKFYFVELEADLETRLERNLTPHRLEQKPSKRDTEWTVKDIYKTMEKYRLNSNEGEITFENYLRINNTNLSPDEVSNMIIERFNLL